MTTRQVRDDETVIRKSELERLLLVERIAPHVASRNLHMGTVADIAARAQESGRYDVKEGKLIELQPVAEFMDDILSDPRNAHLAQQVPSETQTDGGRRSTLAGYTQQQLNAMTPEQRLAAANKAEFDKARKAG